MGCLNDRDNDHWFANIHLSGPCNRSCYFCIGQHMMALDPLNTLDTFPLPGWRDFLVECIERDISNVYLTGSNTDPSLYRHMAKLVYLIRSEINPDILGIRTNGISNQQHLRLFDHVSISVTSLDPEIYQATMGCGTPPNIKTLLVDIGPENLGVNIVLCPETLHEDLARTLRRLLLMGVRRVNLREPYGQPRIGNPIPKIAPRKIPANELYGNPQYVFGDMIVTYRDVHYTNVSSVNLYANGVVSIDYPVTKGHAVTGVVLDQTHFTQGRQRPQWLTR